MNAIREQMHQVYTLTGRRTHYLTGRSSPSDTASASLCGVSPWPMAWFGTGSQDEFEKAAAMPFCSKCARLMRAIEASLPGRPDE